MKKSIALKSVLFALAAAGPAGAQGNSGETAEPPTPATANKSQTEMRSYRSFTIPEKSAEDARVHDAICRDRIHEAREQTGQPPLDREPATGDDALLIWAVDRRMDGCSVLVVKGDPSDIRPIPKIEKRYGLRPAR